MEKKKSMGIEPAKAYTASETAEILHVSTSTLQRMRSRNTGPRSGKWGDSANSPVFYQGIDILRWMQSRKAS